VATINDNGTITPGPTHATADGCLIGYIHTTFQRLTDVFGAPDLGDTTPHPDQGKVRYEWRIDTPDGTACIYDWKTGDHDLRDHPDEVYGWQLGGVSSGLKTWVDNAIDGD
jgi:hypothetical protein